MFHDYLYGYSFLVVTDNNRLTCVLSSAKLDATGRRWLAALRTYNFQLKYRCGRANGDADGLSRRPQQVVELFPEAVVAICQAHTVRRNNCPYIKTLIVSSHSLSVEMADLPPVSTQFRDVDWSRE